MSRPLALNELKKLSAPRTLGHAILLPIENKFRHQLLGELAGVGGHGVEEAALALGEEDVEGEGGLAGTG